MHEGSLYGKSELGDAPRGRLVLEGMENSDLMDVSFHKIIQKFKGRREELKVQFRVAGAMNPMKMMRYKAIIDIDGNNWSSRFGMRLCSNSIVIKIEPDF